MSFILPKVNRPEDLKELDFDSLKKLSGEIRGFLIKKVMETGGHLASNLGVVELTCALHKVFCVPEDDVIWDVGHQCYVHKIICGRKNNFDSLRKYGGISGFPKTAENPCDCFETGHSSTSLSVALGFSSARSLNGEDGHVVAVVGDASFTGGLSMEALNHISQSRKKVIIVLNDNQMSIGKNIGAFAKYLNRIRTKPSYYNMKRSTQNILGKIPFLGKVLTKVVKKAKLYVKYMITPGVVFEQLGYKYLGPIDGHDIEAICSTLEEAKKISEPVVVHVCTVKGKGYEAAEKEPGLFHGVSTGGCEQKTFTAQFGETICKIAGENEKVVSICPSMVDSCGLKTFSQLFPERLFDVGIAEAHAVTFAAGLAKKGFVPVVSVYSSFLQRAYDSIVHDVALEGRHVVFAIDRAGVVGDDGETHQGIYDLSFLSHIPGMTILAPCNNSELDKMLKYAVCEHTGPIAVRYPKGSCLEISDVFFEPLKAVTVREGEDVTIASLGNMVHVALDAAKNIEAIGFSARVINLRCASPVDFDTVFESVQKTRLLVTIEDNVYSGGVGQAIASELFRRRITTKCLIKSFPNEFIPAGSREELYKIYGLDVDTITKEITEKLKAKG